jgi:hypothetical protein
MGFGKDIRIPIAHNLVNGGQVNDNSAVIDDLSSPKAGESGELRLLRKCIVVLCQADARSRDAGDGQLVARLRGIDLGAGQVGGAGLQFSEKCLLGSLASASGAGSPSSAAGDDTTKKTQGDEGAGGGLGSKSCKGDGADEGGLGVHLE